MPRLSHLPGNPGRPKRLDLKAGDWVEVRSQDEILATLDAGGRLRGMPFMPEMLQHCGLRYQVDSRAVIACDTALTKSGRTLRDTVHLRGLRCDGSAHGGCQALCLIFWREAWLKRVDGPGADLRGGGDEGAGPPGVSGSRTRLASGEVDVDDLHRLTTRPRLIDATLYSCQATELRGFSSRQKRYDPRTLLAVLRGGNVKPSEAASVVLWGLKDKVRRRVGMLPVPRVEGRCVGSTPTGRIEGLAVGDWVEVKSKEEIEATLGSDQKNRGLFFDVEMLPYCGKKMRLLRQVDRIIEEASGAMIQLPNDCWILEGGVCSGHVSRRRLFCTRKIYSFWREIWLRPTDPPDRKDEDSLRRELPTLSPPRGS